MLNSRRCPSSWLAINAQDLLTRCKDINTACLHFTFVSHSPKCAVLGKNNSTVHKTLQVGIPNMN